MESFQGPVPNLVSVTLYAFLKDYSQIIEASGPHKTWMYIWTNFKDDQLITLHFDWQEFYSPEMEKQLSRNGKVKLTQYALAWP